eukprot:COSAG02_NODE_759_length_17490_cov_29.152608_4_plen_65_part_00
MMGAAATGHTDIVKALLLARAAKDVRDNFGWTAYDAAKYNNHAGTAAVIEPRYRVIKPPRKRGG